MTDAELRLECLRLFSQNLLSLAKLDEYASWVISGALESAAPRELLQGTPRRRPKDPFVK